MDLNGSCSINNLLTFTLFFSGL